MLATCADREATVDCGLLYEQTRLEMATLFMQLDADQLGTTVPATPDWRVRDVLAHVVGITSDLNRSRFDVTTPEAWTQRQVDERRDATIAEIVVEWDHEAPTFEDGLRLFGYEMGSHYVADLHAHLQDARSALGRAPARDELTVLVALDFFLGSLDEDLRGAGPGAVELRAGSETHVAGDPPVRATLSADPFVILRALSARRSRAQIRALDWDGDVDAVLEHLARYPLPEHDLID
ncbi:MAG: maleylpyruvate isomerase N-terminal domain-containing protein [Acidimicrobiales bacterium]